MSDFSFPLLSTRQSILRRSFVRCSSFQGQTSREQRIKRGGKPTVKLFKDDLKCVFDWFRRYRCSSARFQVTCEAGGAAWLHLYSSQCLYLASAARHISSRAPCCHGSAEHETVETAISRSISEAANNTNI